MRRVRVGRAFGGWSDDPLWASFYDWTVEHPVAGGALWRAGLGSDLRLLYAAADEIGRQPRGARILDVPCGGGVALRGLKPGQGVTYVAADIAQTMLDRTMHSALHLGVDEQVEPRLADVGALPFADGEFDLVVSFTGLHCFPDPRRAVTEMCRVLRPGGVLTGSALLTPRRAVTEMCRVLRPGGVLTGSALLTDTGLRYEPARRVGRQANLLGPSCSGSELTAWLREEGLGDVTLRNSGAIGYFRGAKR